MDVRRRRREANGAVNIDLPEVKIHVKDGINGGMGNAILGTGQAGFAETGRLLASRGFDGFLISENDYCGDRRGYAAQDMAVIHALFTTVA